MGNQTQTGLSSGAIAAVAIGGILFVTMIIVWASLYHYWRKSLSEDPERETSPTRGKTGGLKKKRPKSVDLTWFHRSTQSKNMPKTNNWVKHPLQTDGCDYQATILGSAFPTPKSSPVAAGHSRGSLKSLSSAADSVKEFENCSASENILDQYNRITLATDAKVVLARSFVTSKSPAVLDVQDNNVGQTTEHEHKIMQHERRAARKSLLDDAKKNQKADSCCLLPMNSGTFNAHDELTGSSSDSIVFSHNSEQNRVCRGASNKSLDTVSMNSVEYSSVGETGPRVQFSDSFRFPCATVAHSTQSLTFSSSFGRISNGKAVESGSELYFAGDSARSLSTANISLRSTQESSCLSSTRHNSVSSSRNELKFVNPVRGAGDNYSIRQTQGMVGSTSEPFNAATMSSQSYFVCRAASRVPSIPSIIIPTIAGRSTLSLVCFNVNFKEAIAVVGAPQVFGSWNPDHAPEMIRHPRERSLHVLVVPTGTLAKLSEFKFVRKTTMGNVWYPGDNLHLAQVQGDATHHFTWY